MGNDSGSRTSAGFLGRLKDNPGDPKEWAEFVQRYQPKILQWCRAWGLQEADARDVCQDVLLRLHKKLQVFTYDPSRSFRAWLRTLTHHAWHDFVEARRRGGVGLQQLEKLQSRDDLVQRLKPEFDLEIYEEAKRRVSLRVEPPTWEAFCLLVFDQLPAADVAQRVGMKVGLVYVAKSRVQKMLREEIRKLEGPEENP